MVTRTFGSVLAGILLASATLFIAASEQASAQPQDLNCCTFTINVNLPACPFTSPITLVTDWCPGLSFAFTTLSNGTWIQNIPTSGACPPAPVFLYVTVPPGPPVLLGGTGTAVVGGCVVNYRVSTDPAGCIVIDLF
jgi:hypothetical protein